MKHKYSKIPNRLICQAVTESEPIAGLMLRIGFGVWEKNSYSFIFGPTNHDGCAVLSHDEIVKQTDAIRAFSLMDYQPLEKVFSGDISLKVVGVEEIEAAIRGYDKYHKFTEYPQNYRDSLEKALLNPATEDAEKITVKCLL